MSNSIDLLPFEENISTFDLNLLSYGLLWEDIVIVTKKSLSLSCVEEKNFQNLMKEGHHEEDFISLSISDSIIDDYNNNQFENMKKNLENWKSKTKYEIIREWIDRIKVASTKEEIKLYLILLINTGLYFSLQKFCETLSRPFYIISQVKDQTILTSSYYDTYPLGKNAQKYQNSILFGVKRDLRNSVNISYDFSNICKSIQSLRSGNNKKEFEMNDDLQDTLDIASLKSSVLSYEYSREQQKTTKRLILELALFTVGITLFTLYYYNYI